MTDVILTLLEKAATARRLAAAGYDKVTTERLEAAAIDFERQADAVQALDGTQAKH